MYKIKQPDVKKVCRECGNEYMGAPSGKYCIPCGIKRSKKSTANSREEKKSMLNARAKAVIRIYRRIQEGKQTVPNEFRDAIDRLEMEVTNG